MSFARYNYLLLFFITTPCQAQVLPSDKLGVGVYIDQDTVAPLLNEDRDYTMGIAAEFFWQDKNTGLYPLDGAVKQFGQWLGLHDKQDEIVRSFTLGSLTYTPDDLANQNPIYDDRPYASLLYLSNKRVRTNRNNAVSLEFQLGLLGTGLSGKIQTALHRFWRNTTGDTTTVDPEGWDHQISQGGELTLRVRTNNSQLLYEKRGTWDIAGSGGISLGYQTNINLGVAGRIGKLASASWTLPFDPVNRGNFLPSLADNEWYGWVAYRLRFVGYDALLQGQLRDSEVTFSWDEIEHILHEGGIGFTYTYQPLQLTVSLNSKSPVLKDGPHHHNHFWGGMSVLFRY